MKHRVRPVVNPPIKSPREAGPQAPDNADKLEIYRRDIARKPGAKSICEVREADLAKLVTSKSKTAKIRANLPLPRSRFSSGSSTLFRKRFKNKPKTIYSLEWFADIGGALRGDSVSRRSRQFV
jgi:hypothetical protein